MEFVENKEGIRETSLDSIDIRSPHITAHGFDKFATIFPQIIKEGV